MLYFCAEWVINYYRRIEFRLADFKDRPEYYEFRLFICSNSSSLSRPEPLTQRSCHDPISVVICQLIRRCGRMYRLLACTHACLCVDWTVASAQCIRRQLVRYAVSLVRQSPGQVVYGHGSSPESRCISPNCRGIISFAEIANIIRNNEPSSCFITCHDK